MNGIIFIVDWLLSLALYVVLARLLLQWARADFRNPIAQGIVRITNPLILPLRRVLPPIGKVDTASVVAVVLVAIIKRGILFALYRYGTPGLEVWATAIALELVTTILQVYFFALLMYSLLSLIAPGGYSPLQSILASLCEPILRPFRRLIPPLAGIDLSPLWAMLIIQAILHELP